MLRIEQLTFTRFIAALFIVIYHYGRDCFLFNNDYVSFIFRQANIGVSYFFILSGFVMIVAYHKNSKIIFAKYMKNRLARIYPVYFLAIFLVLFSKLFRDTKFTDLFLNILMMQSWIHEKALTINYPGWSLSVELFFYLSFPFLFNFIYKKNKLGSIAFWIILFWLLSQAIFYLLVKTDLLVTQENIIQDVHYNPLMHLNEFLIGNLAGLYFMSELREKRKKYSVHILFVLLALVLLLKFPFGLDYHNGLLAVIFAPLIILLSLSTDKLTNLFSKKFFVFLGEISFSIYILQVPVWVLFSDYRLNKYLGIDEESDNNLSFFLRLGILVVLSSISYLFFEKPIRNKISNG